MQTERRVTADPDHVCDRDDVFLATAPVKAKFHYASWFGDGSS